MFHCECGENKERKVTQEEARLQKKISKLLNVDLHGVFQKWRKVAKGKNGYPLMVAAEKFAAEHPEHCSLCSIDDSYFASSSILVIHHGTGDNFMGSSWFVLTQLDGQPMCEFFTYSGHARTILEAVKIIGKRSGRNQIIKFTVKPSLFDAFSAKRMKKKWYQDRL